MKEDVDEQKDLTLAEVESTLGVLPADQCGCSGPGFDIAA